MRRKIKFPRILAINWVKGLSVSVIFNNGESRIIDFEEILDRMGEEEGSPAGKLKDPEEFAKMELADYTLSWKNAALVTSGLDGKPMKVPFEIGPDTLFEYSRIDQTSADLLLGRLIKENRIKSGLTQQELAEKSGTTRTYISRIENNRSDIELGTLRKIIEVGLGKTMEIRID